MGSPIRHAPRRRHLRHALVAVLLCLSCDRPAPSGEPKDRGAPAANQDGTVEAPPYDFQPGRDEVLLTWIDGEGRFQLAETIDEIPSGARKRVRVVRVDQPPGTSTHVYVADLTNAGEARPVTLSAITRADWEAGGLKFRRAAVEPLEKAQGTGSEPGKLSASALQAAIIIYGASWCGPCHQAEDYLKKKGLKVTMKDIEEDPGASREMRDKLKRSGLSGSSIPIIDVGGTLLVGFSARALDRALSKL